MTSVGSYAEDITDFDVNVGTIISVTFRKIILRGIALNLPGEGKKKIGDIFVSPIKFI